jgi:hypothetical protein
MQASDWLGSPISSIQTFKRGYAFKLLCISTNLVA